MSKKYILVILALVALALNACNLPRYSGNAVETAAAETIEALQAQGVADTPALPATTQAPSSDPPSSDPTSPPAAPNTPFPTNTPSPEPVCDLAGFITDVTIPDGTIMTPGETFTKTWRLINNGSCAWTSGYSLYFFSGDQMGGPSSQQLTPSIVNPGQSVAISVNLTAPAAAGAYKGNWKIKNPSGDIFSLNGGIPFFIEIQVVEPSGPSTFTVTLTDIARGGVRSDALLLIKATVGDLTANVGAQGFVRFNISSIPSNATITEVLVDFSSYSIYWGDPFGNLGCLRAYQDNYFPLDVGDYFAGNPINHLTTWCTPGQLSTVSAANTYFKSVLQFAVGSNYFEMRLQHNLQTNNDTSSDWLIFDPGALTLVITYTTP
jgi:hypothetical protein